MTDYQTTGGYTNNEAIGREYQTPGGYQSTEGDSGISEDETAIMPIIFTIT